MELLWLLRVVEKMEPSIIILRGISGSGKSVLANRVVDEFADSVVVSADNYFLNDDGKYEYDARGLSAAHLVCFQDFLDNVNEEVDIIVVDNRSLRAEEITPYWMVGRSYGYEVVVVNVHEFDLDLCYRRNQHGVSYNAIVNQFQLMNRVEMPVYLNFVRSEDLLSYLERV
jgi:predicted kinase